ncbi:MAG: accessory factor UbiK family protein [Alphaproteobacteria bacterium]|nr:accessory factor UbiK family protein [Alphaproteobacteria bacterium]
MTFKPDPKFLDDVAKMAGGAVSVLSSVRAQIKEDIKARVDDVADRLDLVPREDFERLQSMVTALVRRVDQLEGAKKTSSSAPKKSPPTRQTKPPSKKKPTKKK